MDYIELDPENFSFDPERHALELPFPIENAAGLVQINDAATGKFLGFLRDPRGLSAEIEKVRATTRITEIVNLNSSYGITRWEVKTPQGEQKFEVPDRDMIRSFPGGRIFLRDADGKRFEIENLATIDKRSRELIEKET